MQKVLAVLSLIATFVLIYHSYYLLSVFSAVFAVGLLITLKQQRKMQFDDMYGFKDRRE